MKKISTGTLKKVMPYVSVLLLIVLVMVIFAMAFISYVKTSIHNERTVSISNQAETTAGLIDQIITKYSEYLDVCSNVIGEELEENANVYDFIDYINTKMYYNGARLILVDKNCTWYGEKDSFGNPTTGRITAIENYEKNTSKKAVYITTGVDVDIESFVFRVRLKNPINVATENGSAEICYAALIYYMDTLQEQISVAFPFDCNKFIVDKDGLMLYKDFGYGVLINGTNLFTKYEQVLFLYEDSGTEQVAKIKKGKTTVAEFRTDDGDYFIAASPLEVNSWSVSFVVKSESISAGAYMSGISIFVVVFCSVFAAAAAFATVFLFHIRKGKEQLADNEKVTDRMKQDSTAKSKFLANMSHDLRTPIDGIMGMVAIAEKQENPPKTDECLSNIKNESFHLISLVNDIVDINTIENGKLVLASTPANVAEICKICSETARELMNGRRLAFITDFTQVPSQAYMADALRLEQVINNILSNAVKFTPDGGRISFKASVLVSTEKVDTIRFEFVDSGVGMNREFVSRIFEPFAQEGNDSGNGYKGTGLGMAITKKYVDLMGGTINVSSVYGKGSIFTVNVPFAKSTVSLREKQENNGEASIKGMKILVAEDNELNMLVEKELLEYSGASVVCAANGKEAVKKFEEAEDDELDAILMDVTMPIMNGLEATRVIRVSSKKNAKTIPIIAMTANAYEDDVKASEEAGMNDHLVKPIDHKQVVETIYKYVKK